MMLMVMVMVMVMVMLMTMTPECQRVMLQHACVCDARVQINQQRPTMSHIQLTSCAAQRLRSLATVARSQLVCCSSMT